MFCECEFSSNLPEFEKINEENFNTFLNLAFDLLSQEKKIYLKDKNGIYEFSFKNEFIGDFLLPCDIKAIIQFLFVQMKI